MRLRIARIRESNEKMRVDEIADRLQTCAFNETSVPKLGTEWTGGISVMGADRVTGMEAGNRHKVDEWMEGGRRSWVPKLSRSSRAHRSEAA